jgi:NADH-quinone oxidoreductase subunit M
VMVLFGTFRNGANPDRFTIFQVATVLALWGVVISAVYMLRAYRSVFMGAVGESWSGVTDLRRGLRVPIGILVAMSLWFGFVPQSFVQIVSPTFKSYFAPKR